MFFAARCLAFLGNPAATSELPLIRRRAPRRFASNQSELIVNRKFGIQMELQL